MLIGTHAVIYSSKPDADRKFLREVLGLRHVDANPGQELFLMCDDIKCWGLLTTVELPGGGKLGVYQPKHDRP